MKKKRSSAKRYEGFTAEERAAMKDRVQEMKVAAADGETAVLAKISEMQERDRTMAERLHALIKDSAPGLTPRLWYGMPAYAKNGKVLCFFQSAQKFKTRYPVLGFSDVAKLDEGNVWPTYFAVMKLTSADEARIAALVKKAAS